MNSRHYLDLAARLALRGAGRVEPNPMVGCVLVKNGEIIGLGHHKRIGELHAEREALADCRRRGIDTAGATAYVTLEPCNGHGKQPPCVDALLEAKVARVVYARPDPTQNKGGGAARLRAGGVACEECHDSRLALALLDPFMKRLKTGLPWVIAKWAQTIDGRVATRSGESQWISGERSRARVHRLRSRVDAILTGSGTVAADDPMLTARLPGGREPRRPAIRVVADTDLDIDVASQLVRTARDGTPTLVACAAELLNASITAEKLATLALRGVKVLGVPTNPSGQGVDLLALLGLLHADFGVSTVLLESGPALLGSMLEADLIDEAVVYVAPMMLGDEFARAAAVGRVADRLSAAKRFRLSRVKALDGDIELTYRTK
jgi:diaminohydroxyphosphoribosylaminopyrimidine deaminase / 5-amino-6-(5-phosphoribosylamino)uracil reductase